MKLRQTLVRFGPPVAGVVLAICAWRVIADGQPRPDTSPPVVTPAKAPRNTPVVAGAGLVEPASELIAIANQVPGVISRVFVSAGQAVRQGQPLYALDDSDLRAELAVRRSALRSASRRVTVAEVDLQERLASLDLYERIEDQRAISTEEMNRRRFAVQSAQARLQEAHAAISEAQATVDDASARLALRMVRAPIAGTVLQIRARPGQFAPASQLAEPLITMGQLTPLHVRVDIDESDISRLGPAIHATVSARGGRNQATSATLVRIEPLVVPKRSLTNAVSERVDTRVLQAVFALPADTEGFWVGQQVDAFIEAGAAR